MEALLIAVAFVIVELPAIFMRLYPFRPILTKKQKLMLILGYVLILAVNFLASYYFAQRDMADATFYKVKLILSGLALCTVNLIVLWDHWAEQIFVFGIEATLSTILPVFIAFVASFFVELSSQRAAALNAVAYSVIYTLVYPFFSKMLYNCITPFLSLKTDKYWKTIFLIPGAIFMGTSLLYTNGYVANFQQLVGQVLIFFATILITLSISQDAYRMRTREMAAMNAEMQRQYYHSLTKQVETARKHLHDAKYVTVSIQRFIETDDKQGLTEFCKTLIPKQYYKVEMFHSGNAAVDGVLYHYVQRAEAENVKFKIAGTVRNPGIADDEMCILLGNALENAFTACQTIEEGRFVTFTAQTEANVLSIMVQNSFDGRVDTKHGIIQSRKRTSGPGIGMSSMREICERNGGVMQTQWKDNIFTVLMILTLK